MRVAVDADGVLADRVGAALDRVQNWYGPAIPKDRVRDWEYELPGLPVEIGIGDVIGTTSLTTPSRSTSEGARNWSGRMS